MTWREWLSLLGDLDGTIAMVTAVAVPSGIWLWRKFNVWRIELTQHNIKTEIEFIERLAASPSERSGWMQHRMLWIFCVVGIWMFSQFTRTFPDGVIFESVMSLCCGAAIYGIATDTLSTMRRIKKAPETLIRLRKILGKFETRKDD